MRGPGGRGFAGSVRLGVGSAIFFIRQGAKIRGTFGSRPASGRGLQGGQMAGRGIPRKRQAGVLFESSPLTRVPSQCRQPYEVQSTDPAVYDQLGANKLSRKTQTDSVAPCPKEPVAGFDLYTWYQKGLQLPGLYYSLGFLFVLAGQGELGKSFQLVSHLQY